MKKLIFTLALGGAMLFAAESAVAGGVIIYSTGEKIEVAQKIADTLFEDEHVNLGVMYDQFSIFWVPMWNYGEVKYVLVNDKKDTYYDLSEEDMEVLRTDYGMEIAAEPKIGFWNRVGGKIVWGIVIVVLALIWWFAREKKKDGEGSDAGAGNGNSEKTAKVEKPDELGTSGSSSEK